MTPDALKGAREFVSWGELDEALTILTSEWDPADALASEAADLKAGILFAKGDTAGALEPLAELVVAGNANFHTHYRLAEYHRALGNIDQTILNHRLAHAQFGWTESVRHGYSFTHDYFSPNIPAWESWFKNVVTAAPIEALEIGSWQGGSASWLLDKVISRRGGRLTCIDTFEGSSEHAHFIGGLGSSIETMFDNNIIRTGHGDKLRKLVGYSQVVLPTLWGEKFDFIFIDGAHEAQFVIQDAVLCWGLIQPGGFILFDDANFTFAQRPMQNTIRALEFFLSVFGDDLKIIDQGAQLLIQRTR